MEMLPVDSSVIEAYGYEDHELVIELKNGAAYQFSKVPKRVWEAFEGAKSKGTFFNKHIRGRYETTRLS